MRRSVVIALSLLVAAATLGGAAYAQNAAAIAQRKALLSEMGQATFRPIGGMMRGEAPFDLAAVQNALTIIQRNAPRLAALFPADSQTGAETRALPAIWQNKADFEPRFARMVQAAADIAPRITDLASLRTHFGPFLRDNCVACHNTYQRPQ